MTALRKTPVALDPDAAPFVIRAERASDVVAREALLDACFGVNRQMRTCQRLRDGRAPAEGLALSVVHQGRLVGTVRLWHVSAGGVPALVLGPLAVDPSCRKLGIGQALMNHALAAAKRLGHGEGYRYAHNFPGGIVEQDYLGVDKTYYTPTDRGYEAQISQRLTEQKSRRVESAEELPE